MKISRLVKYNLILPIIIIIAILLDYFVAVFLSKTIMGYFYPDNDFITFYETSMCAILAAIVPLAILYIQIRASHNQFAYVQKKNDIVNLINILLDYLKVYNIDELKQLLFDWQHNYKSNKDLQIRLLELKEGADRIWLRLSLSVNQDNKVSCNFISTQESNYNMLCEIYEDLRVLFCYNYSEAIIISSEENTNISLIREHLSHCLKEELLVKAVFQKYDISYEIVKEQVFSFISILKSKLNNTYHIYGKTEDKNSRRCR